MTPLETVVLNWLARQGPREWHGVAAHWNWDNGVEPLLWVLEQRECDKGTALSVFWSCDPYYQMDERHPQYSEGREDNRIAQKVLQLWPQYRTARFKFELPWHTGNLHLPNHQLSPETLARLQPLMISVPGNEPYPLYAEGLPAECRIAYKELRGEPVSQFDRELLMQEQAGSSMSATDSTAAARREQELQESLAEFDEILDEVKRMRRNDQ